MHAGLGVRATRRGQVTAHGFAFWHCAFGLCGVARATCAALGDLGACGCITVSVAGSDGAARLRPWLDPRRSATRAGPWAARGCWPTGVLVGRPPRPLLGPRRRGSSSGWVVGGRARTGTHGVCAGLAGYLLVASPWRRCSEHACHSMEKIGLCGARPACDAKAGRNRSSYSHRAAVAVRSVNVARRTISSTSATTTTTTARFTTLPTCCPTSTVGGGVVTEDGGGGGCGVHQGEMGYHR